VQEADRERLQQQQSVLQQLFWRRLHVTAGWKRLIERSLEGVPVGTPSSIPASVGTMPELVPRSGGCSLVQA
jgi:hypothetical protein